jgi:hypothetical protein
MSSASSFTFSEISRENVIFVLHFFVTYATSLTHIIRKSNGRVILSVTGPAIISTVVSSVICKDNIVTHARIFTWAKRG